MNTQQHSLCVETTSPTRLRACPLRACVQVLEELKASEALKAYVQEQVGSSKTLNSDSARASRDRKKVLDDLQKELQ